MRQKFRRLAFVHVCKDMPPWMAHFDSDFDAIIDGTYSQLYGGRDVDSYSLFQIEDGQVVNHISWYKEEQLTLLPKQDQGKAEQMVEDYRFAE